MKLSLTQAWEAKGFSGAILRQNVAMELIKRRNKEDPERAKNVVYGGVVATIGMVLTLVTYLVFVWAIDSIMNMRWLDLSLTEHFLFVVLGGFGIVVAFAISIGMTIHGIAVLWKTGLIDRYIFQHRDDEVEL